MSYSYESSSKTLIIGYNGTNVVYNSSEYSENEVFVINVSYGFTKIIDVAFKNYAPVYEINLPESITTLGNDFLAYSKVKSFHIPNSYITPNSGQCFDWCNSLEELDVDDDHPTLLVKDGVLYSKDMRTLYFYPNAKKDLAYNVQEGVETLFYTCFAQTRFLKHLILPRTVSSISHLLYYSHSIENVTIFRGTCSKEIVWSDMSENAFDVKKVVYKDAKYMESLSSDRKTLTVYPMSACGEQFFDVEFNDVAFAGDKTIETVIFNRGISNITSSAFKGCSRLKHAAFPQTLKYIDNGAFSGCGFEYNSVIYPSDLKDMYIKHFSKYALGLCPITRSCPVRKNSFYFIMIMVISY